MKKEQNKVGHNSKIQRNPALKEIFADIAKLEDDRRAIGQDINEQVARIKEEHGFSKAATRIRLRRNRMDKNVAQLLDQEVADMAFALGDEEEESNVKPLKPAAEEEDAA